MNTTIAHISDIHFGRIVHPRIVEHLLQEINDLCADVVVVSGDLTMRARRHEFEAAAAMLDAFTSPVIVVPGNHDVYPWFQPYRRLTRPLGRYRKYISENLAPSYQRNGLAVLGISSAHGRTIKGGRVTGVERRTIKDFFEGQNRRVFKVLVLHHHLTKIQALAPHDVARQARKALEMASHVGVDLILCGHLHISHIEPLEVMPERHRIVIASAGTATSDRGRGARPDSNLYNVIRVYPDAFEIEERLYDPAAHGFIRHGNVRFERTFTL